MRAYRACEAAVASLVVRITLCYNTIELQDAAIRGKGQSQVRREVWSAS
jgi:hypothetical protein